MVSSEHLMCSLLTYKKQDWQALTPGGVVRILDVGCGQGNLMAALKTSLEKTFPGVVFEVHGLEVAEHCGARKGYFDKVVKRLSEKCPGVAWDDHLHVCSDGAPWPFENDYFDGIVSSQVIEHVRDHELFFAQHARVMMQNGVGIHEFPLREIFMDPHLYLPYVHRIKDYEVLQSYIRFMSRLGIGKYRGEYKREKQQRGFSLEDYVNYQSEYAWFQLNYVNRREALALAKRHRMKGDFRLTMKGVEALLARLRLCKRDTAEGYNLARLRKFSMLIPLVMCRSSATLVLRKSRLQRYGVWC